MLLQKLLSIIPLLLNILPKDVLKNSLTNFVEDIENQVKNSQTKVDDALILPLIALVRASFSIDDLADKFIPGDLENRKAFLSIEVAKRGLTLSDEDKINTNKILYIPSGWQDLTIDYLNNLVVKQGK